MKLGDKILELRKKNRFSQEDLGEKIGVTRQTISNWELGETAPNPEQLKLLSKYLNVSIDELLDNDIHNVLVHKVSNTEKLAGLILKIIKIALIGIPLFLLIMFILVIIFKNVRNKDTGMLIEESIYCTIYGEEHSYTITYQEYTGRPVGEGGDTYFYDILDLGKYNDAHQIFNIINDYVKKNGGTCEIVRNKHLNDIVNMYIKDGTLTKTGATVIIEDTNPNRIVYGSSFYIEKYNASNHEWESVIETSENYAFNDMAYYVDEKGKLEMKQDWTHMYGSLDKGFYRLVKDVFFESDIPVTEEDKYYIWTEFEIE